MDNKAVKFLSKPFARFVILPLCVFAFYQLLWATDRYESTVQLLVQQSNGNPILDPTAVLLAGFAGSATSNDIELVRTYIHSNDMLAYLREKMDFDKHYSRGQIDVFSRLSEDATSEGVLDYYIEHVKLYIDEKSAVLTIKVQGFEPVFTRQLASNIASRAEWFVNKINQELAKSQLDFVKSEHKVVEQKLEKAKTSLLAFQRRYNLIDPTAESIALQQITSQLDAQIVVKQAQLNALLNTLSENAGPVLLVKQELVGLKAQLENERGRMTAVSDESRENVSPKGVSDILARFSEHKVNLELALQAYTASQLSIEKARIDAYRQIKYLVMVETATFPEEATYPKVTYNILLFTIVDLLLFGIVKMLIATFKELR